MGKAGNSIPSVSSERFSAALKCLPGLISSPVKAEVMSMSFVVHFIIFKSRFCGPNIYMLNFSIAFNRNSFIVCLSTHKHLSALPTDQPHFQFGKSKACRAQSPRGSLVLLSFLLHLSNLLRKEQLGTGKCIVLSACRSAWLGLAFLSVSHWVWSKKVVVVRGAEGGA